MALKLVAGSLEQAEYTQPGFPHSFTLPFLPGLNGIEQA